MSPDANYIGRIAIVPLSQTKLHGPGVTIVKMSFQKESAARHLNEALYLLSQEELKEHFTLYGKLVPELITVDSGLGEWPKNKST